MGWTILYIAFAIVALWLLGEVLLQYKARLRWRLLAFCGFLCVVIGVVMYPSVPLIGVGTAAFAVGQTFVTLSFRRGFSTGWALRRVPGLPWHRPEEENQPEAARPEQTPPAPQGAGPAEAPPPPPAAPAPPPPAAPPTGSPEPAGQSEAPAEDTAGYAAYGAQPEPPVAAPDGGQGDLGDRATAAYPTTDWGGDGHDDGRAGAYAAQPGYGETPGQPEGPTYPGAPVAGEPFPAEQYAQAPVAQQAHGGYDTGGYDAGGYPDGYYTDGYPDGYTDGYGEGAGGYPDGCPGAYPDAYPGPDYPSQNPPGQDYPGHVYAGHDADGGYPGPGGHDGYGGYDEGGYGGYDTYYGTDAPHPAPLSSNDPYQHQYADHTQATGGYTPTGYLGGSGPADGSGDGWGGAGDYAFEAPGTQGYGSYPSYPQDAYATDPAAAAPDLSGGELPAEYEDTPPGGVWVPPQRGADGRTGGYAADPQGYPYQDVGYGDGYGGAAPDHGTAGAPGEGDGYPYGGRY